MLAEMLVGISERLLAEGKRRVAEARGRPRGGAGRADRGHIDFALDDRALITLHDRELDRLPDSDRKLVRQLQRQYVELWVEVVRELYPALPERRPGPPCTPCSGCSTPPRTWVGRGYCGSGPGWRRSWTRARATVTTATRTSSSSCSPGSRDTWSPIGMRTHRPTGRSTTSCGTRYASAGAGCLSIPREPAGAEESRPEEAGLRDGAADGAAGDAEIRAVEARILRVLWQLAEPALEPGSRLTVVPYIRRHLAEHAAAAGLLDEAHLPARFLPYADPWRLRVAAANAGGDPADALPLLPVVRQVTHLWKWDDPARNAATIQMWAALRGITGNPGRGVPVGGDLGGRTR